MLPWIGAYLNLNGPCEVADVDEERNVWAVAEIKVLVGEAVFELPDVAPGHYGNLLAGLCSCWMRCQQRLVGTFPITRRLTRVG